MFFLHFLLNGVIFFLKRTFIWQCRLDCSSFFASDFHWFPGVPHICDCVPTASRLFPTVSRLFPTVSDCFPTVSDCFPTVSRLFQFAASIDRNCCNPDWNLGFWCYFRLQYLFPPSNLVVCSHCFCLLPQAVFTAWFPLVLLVYVQRCWHGFFCLQCCLLCLPDSRSPAFKHGFLYVRLVLIVGPHSWCDFVVQSLSCLIFSTSLIVFHHVISHTIIF